MAAALRRYPRSLLCQNPFASLSTAAAPEIEPPPPPPAATIALKAILSQPDLDRLVALFHSTAHQKRSHFDPSLYSLAVRTLTRANRRDLIEPLLDHAASHPEAPQSDGFLARIITLYASAGMLDHAVRTFDRAVAAGRPLGERSLCALLTSFLKAGQFDRAVETFNHVPKQLNITPTIYTHNILLHVLCKKGDLAAARQLLDEMANRDSARPDINSYTTVLSGYLWKGDEAGASDMLEEIESKGLVPDARTYHCRIAAFCRKEEMLKAEELLDEMAAKEIPVNIPSFKMIMKAYCIMGDMESTLRVFARMKGMEDMTPDSDSYNILLKGLVRKGEFGSALEVCKECLARKLSPAVGLVKRLAKGLREKSKVDEAKDIADKMRDVLKDGDLDSWKKVEIELSL